MNGTPSQDSPFDTLRVNGTVKPLLKHYISSRLDNDFILNESGTWHTALEIGGLAFP